MAGTGVRGWFSSWLSIAAVALLGVALGPVSSAWAQVGSARYASMVIEAQSGRVVSAVNADEYRFPASLTKMMTLYLTFEALRSHRLGLSDTVPFSAWSSSMPPTKLGVPPGAAITVEQAILALVTRSANDAAAALAEKLAGSEEQFAEVMTIRAHALGMAHTTFRNASGLPDWGQVTTARDIVLLGRHLIQDFPEYYHYFSTPMFQFHGRVILNHQALLRSFPGADGLKTGYTEASGFNVVTSAVRGDVRLIGVVLGAASGAQRDVNMAGLLNEGFRELGVAPVEVAHRGVLPFRLIATAHAAPLPPRPYVTPVAPSRHVARTGHRPAVHGAVRHAARARETVPRARWVPHATARHGQTARHEHLSHGHLSRTAEEARRRSTRG